MRTTTMNHPNNPNNSANPNNLDDLFNQNTINNSPENENISPDMLPNLLKLYELKVTSGRLKLLDVLLQEKSPVSSEFIENKFDENLDRASIYRALQVFVKAGLVQRIDFSYDHVKYELAVGREHHHHIVCVSCNLIEDVEMCNIYSLQNSARKVSRRFHKIMGHSLEFSGICRNCSLRKDLLTK